MNYGFIIDNRKCIGCHACTVACKSEHDTPIGVNRTWVKYIEKGAFPNTRRLFTVMRCNHCADAPCVEICPVTALFVRPDGIVDFDQRRCIGCKSCMQACPYDALYIDPESHTAAKCNYCAHRVDLGLEPACVNVCPEHAIISGDMDNPLSEIAQLLSREQVTTRKPEKGTQPKLFYIDGDDISLNPTAAEPSETYMWSTQSSGVGHFAKFAASKAAEADPQQMSDLLSGRHRDAESSSEGPDSSQKANDSIQEHTKRVYDAPDKGILWGWEVSAYIWTKAISTGALLVPFIAKTFGFTAVPDGIEWIGIISALLFLMATGALLVIDLDQPKRFAYVLLRPQWRSWLVRGSYAITLYGLTLGLLVVARLVGWSAVESILWWVGAALAVITAVYTAFLFAQAKGRDFWQSPTLSLHMLVHAIMAGAAIFGVSAILTDDTAWLNLVSTVIKIAIAVNLAVITIELITTHPTLDATRTVKLITSGPFKITFWVGCILIGNVLPLLVLGFGGTDSIPVAGVVVLIGLYITEHIWVRAPQLIPLS